MVQNGSKTYHLEHLGGLWPAMLENATKTSHLEHLGGLGPERVQNDTKTDCLEHLGGIGSEIMPKMKPKLTIWSIWTALGPKLSKNT